MPFSAGTPNEENNRVVATSRRGSEGGDIVDVSASDARLRELEGLDALARRRGVTAVSRVGLSSGLTNLQNRRSRGGAW